MYKVLITTVPFASMDPYPLQLLNSTGIEYLVNPIGKKLKESELLALIPEYDIVIAGTELITDKVMSAATRLKLISRVGVGLDGVDLLAAHKRNIKVSYTPEAPAPAVAELTIGLIFSLLRSIHVANAEMHRGVWQRHFGYRISEVVIGVIGAGRIGSKVIKHLLQLGCRNVLVNDVQESLDLPTGASVEFANKDEIYRRSDIITLHIPLTLETREMISENELSIMREGAMIVNTSRGEIISENALIKMLTNGRLGGAAIDVFEQEPYGGPLSKIENCLLTSHMGSMSVDCRSAMEIEATEEAIRFITGQPLKCLVPYGEYEIRRKELKKCKHV
jgi:D-3-phosphoglycerate dehydrogenase